MPRAILIFPELCRGSLIFAVCAPATGRRYRCSDRGVGEASTGASRQRRGSGGLWGQTHGRTARRRVMEAVTMVTKVGCFWVPLWWDVVGTIADMVFHTSHLFLTPTLSQSLRSISLFSTIWLESIFKSRASVARGGAVSVSVPGFPVWLSFGNDCQLFYHISRSSSFSHCCWDFIWPARFSHQHQPPTSSFSSCLSSALFTQVMLFITITSSCITGRAQ